LSRQLPTGLLPTPPVSPGYCGRNHRFFFVLLVFHVCHLEQLRGLLGLLLALEIVVRGEDGRNGMKAKLTELCQRFDAFEQKAIRWISIGTSLPGIVVGVVAALRFLGKA
jgi:hypothetical protein